MATIAKSEVMRRAWRLFRLSLALRFDRAAFAACLSQAWADLRRGPEVPVTPWPTLQRYAVIFRTMTRADVIERLEAALTVARGRAGQYVRAGVPANRSAARHRSADLMRVANLTAILATEKAAAPCAA